MLTNTENWANAFFQVSVALLVFGLSFPAAMLSLTRSGKLLKVSWQTLLGMWMRMPLLILALIALYWVWLYYPGLGLYSASFLRFVPQIAISLGLIITLIYCLYMVKITTSLEFTLGYLKRRIINNMKRRRISRFEEGINDFIDIGSECQAGFEKEMIVNCCAEIAFETMSEPTYRGCSIDIVLNALESAVLQEPATGNRDNLGRCLTTLQLVGQELKRLKYDSSPDMGIVLDCMKRIGLFAVESGYDQQSLLAVEYLGSIGNGSEKQIYELGKMAYQRKNEKLIITIMGQLLTMGKETALRRESIINRVLGLIALSYSEDNGVFSWRYFDLLWKKVGQLTIEQGVYTSLFAAESYNFDIGELRASHAIRKLIVCLQQRRA